MEIKKWRDLFTLKFFAGSILAAIIGVVFLAIIPLVGRIIVAILQTISQTYREYLYASIAQDDPARIGFSLFTIVVNALLFGLAGYVTFIGFKLRETHEIASRLHAEIKEVAIEERELQVLKWVRSTRKWAISSTVVFSLIISFLIVRNATETVITVLTRQYHQAVRICRPYVTSEEMLKIDSDFSQIRSFDEYSAVMKRLESVAQKNKLRFPR